MFFWGDQEVRCFWGVFSKAGCMNNPGAHQKCRGWGLLPTSNLNNNCNMSSSKRMFWVSFFLSSLKIKVILISQEAECTKENRILPVVPR